jgi:hypothetical protein
MYVGLEGSTGTCFVFHTSSSSSSYIARYLRLRLISILIPFTAPNGTQRHPLHLHEGTIVVMTMTLPVPSTNPLVRPPARPILEMRPIHTIIIVVVVVVIIKKTRRNRNRIKRKKEGEKQQQDPRTEAESSRAWKRTGSEEPPSLARALGCYELDMFCLPLYDT